jgi:hypothetical protein
MFSQSIVENDVFLDMPLSTQALYFHLGMNAVDDGFVSPKRVMRMIGANNDDLQILLAKRYVLTFPSGVVVIKHWLLNNFIRSDRYAKTTYASEIASLTKNEYGAYTEIDRITTVAHELTETVYQMDTNGIPNDIPTVDPGKVRLGKDRLENSIVTKVTIGDDVEKVDKVPSKTLDAMFDYWESTVGYAITSKKKQNREYAGKLFKEYSKQEVAAMVQAAALASEDQYAPGISDFIDLYRKWDKLKLWGKKQGGRVNAVARF